MIRSHHGPPTAPDNDTGQPATGNRQPATGNRQRFCQATAVVRDSIIAQAARRVGGVFTRAMDMDLAQRMLDVVARIPAGKVATYGDVAARAGSRSPRLAGFVLAQLVGRDTPWHRVLRANGTPAPHLANEQLGRLRSEGVEVLDGRVSLRRFRWRD